MVNEVDPFVLRYLRQFVHRDHCMLDVGCGPAPYRSAVSGRYVGLDILVDDYIPGSPRRVDVAAAGHFLPFAAACFDLVFTKSAFFLLPSPESALAEFRRVLKHGGRVLILDYNRRTQRRLQAKEGVPRPCWTQWQLRAMVARAGFRDVELLLPMERDVGAIERLPRLLFQEFFGTWAIVTARK